MIKAISLWQPWASAISLGLKQYETRHWPTNYRGELIICAAKKNNKELWQIYKHNRSFYSQEDRDKFPHYTDLPFGATVAKVNLVDCIKMEKDLIESMTELEKLWGDWYAGRYAWKFENIQALEPVPVTGRQGLFNIDEELIKIG